MAYNTGSIPSAEGKKEYTLELDNFLGVDFAHNPLDVDPRRSPNAENMFSIDGVLQKRAGYNTITWFYDAFNNYMKGNQVNGVYLVDFDNADYVIHYGTDVLKLDSNYAPTLLYSGISNNISVGKVFNNVLYILDGNSYYQYDGTTFKEVEGFIPTTSIGRTPQGGGQYLYATNLLQTYRKNKFLADGTSTVYQLSDSGLDDNKITVSVLGTGGEMIVSIPEKIDLSANEYGFVVDRTTGMVTFNKSPYSLGYNYIRIKAVDARGEDCKRDDVLYYNETSFRIGKFLPLMSEYVTVSLGVTVVNKYTSYLMNEYTTAFNEGQLGTIINSCFTVNRNTGQIIFTTAPSVSPLDGWDNIEVKYSVTDSEYGNRIHGCDIMATYGYNGAGDRLVLSGNPNLPNWDFISAIDDPTYFPSTMYSIIGSETTAIMGYAIMADGTQAIIKEGNGVDPATYYREGILLSDEQLFSVKEGSVNGGAIAKRSFAYANNEPLFLSNEGVKTIVPVENTTVDERCVLQRSYFVNDRLMNEDECSSIYNPSENLTYANSIYYKGYYFLAINGHVYVANTNIHSSIQELNEWQYEWFYFTDLPVRVWFIGKDNKLYFGDKIGNICRFDFFNTKATTADGNTEDTRYCLGDNNTYVSITFPVSCKWCTPLFDLGSSVYTKNVKRTNFISLPYYTTSIEMNIDYLVSYPSDSAIKSAELNNLSIDNSDSPYYNYFSQSNNFNPEIIAVKQKAKKAKLIGFRFKSTDKYRCNLLKFVCTYTYGGKIKN